MGPEHILFFVIFLQQIKCPRRHSTQCRVMAGSQTLLATASLLFSTVSRPSLIVPDLSVHLYSGDTCTHVFVVHPYYCIKYPIFSWNYDRFVIIFYSLSVSRLNFCSLFNFIHKNKHNFVIKKKKNNFLKKKKKKKKKKK